MTSGNLSDEPIAVTNEDARETLRTVADAFLMHDRDIHVRCDDSVAAVFRGKTVFHRRSRGYTPLPVPLPAAVPGILALGGELKNVVCVTRDDRAFLSHHIGDLEYLETVRAFESAVDHLVGLFRVRPEAIAHDLHPEYRSTRYALARAAREGLPLVGVQHHHAHIAAGMADNGLSLGERVIGAALDGTGYGTDGSIWGGEFLVAGYRDFHRILHLAGCPLPGGDAAVRNPSRMALAWLRRAGIPWDPSLPPVAAASIRERETLERMLDQGINTPLTSSMGRLFDAAASLCGIRHRVTYEAQAASELEAAYDPSERGAYRFAIEDGVLDPSPALRDLAADVRAGRRVGILSARFHHGVADAVTEACRRIRDTFGLDRVVLSGGVWQNLVLLREATRRLEAAEFQVLAHRRVPTNDGGLALGQAMVAAARLRPVSEPPGPAPAPASPEGKGS
jgi:hydrogenase maturation protein HypF